MKKKFKTNMLFVLMALCLAGSAAAQPSIHFEGKLGEDFSMAGGGSDGTHWEILPHTFSSIKRHLGKKMPEIVKIQYFPKTGLGIYEKNTRKVQKQTLLNITYHHKDENGLKGSLSSLATYIIGAKNLSEGYCLIHPMDITEFMTDPFVQSIQALPENPNYLSDKIVNPHPDLLTIRFYEKEHPEFIERYGVMSVQRKDLNTWVHALLLDAYYPKNLEAELQPDMLQALNTFIGEHAALADAIAKVVGQ